MRTQRNINYNIDKNYHINQYVDKNKQVKYLYYPEFDNVYTTIGQAYDLYNIGGIVHIHKGKDLKCYAEILNCEKDDYELGIGADLIDFV